MTGEHSVSGAPQFAVFGAFDSDERADAAFAALSERGLPATKHALETEGPERVRARGPQGRPPLLWRAIWLGFWWSVAGAAVGALIGLTLGVLGVRAPAIGTSIALEVASWAMFLHIGGALLGIYLALSSSDAWGADDAATLRRDIAGVRVTSNDRADTDIAQRVLWEQGASSVVQEHTEGQNQTWQRARIGR